MAQQPNPMLGQAAPGGIAALAQGQPPQQAPTGAQTPAPAPAAGKQSLNPQLQEMVDVFEQAKQAKMQAAAANQAAMTAPQLPPINQQLQQVRAAMAPAPEPAPQPQGIPAAVLHAARGGMMPRGGVDRLRSNLSMAGGGIVGFFGGGPTEGKNVWPDAAQDRSKAREQAIMDAAKQAAENNPTGPSAMDIFKKVLVALKLRHPENADLPVNQRGQGFDDPRIAAMGKPNPGSTPASPPDVVKKAAEQAAARAAGKPSGAGSASVTQGSRSMGGDPTAPQEAPDAMNPLRSATEKTAMDFMGVNDKTVRDDDAGYVRDNSGIPAVLAARAAREQEMRDAQAAIAGASKPNFMQNLGAAGKENRGFRRENGLMTLLGDVGSADRMTTAQDIANKKDAYAKLLEIHKQGEGSDKITLDGNTAASAAGLEGAKGARRDKVAGAQVGSELIRNDETVKGRLQQAQITADARKDAAAYAAQARQDAKAAGADNKMLALLSNSQSKAMAVAERIASEAARSPVKGMDVDVPALTLQIYKQTLAQDPVYAQVMGQLGIKPVKEGNGGSKVLKFDNKGNPI